VVPFIPPKLVPWIDFGPNEVILKPDAPKELYPLYEKLKNDMANGQDQMNPKL
jgi:hypothetical protein